ncbi:MAG: (2Fe-2S)-binding protein [Spirochaetota bacterium]
MRPRCVCLCRAVTEKDIVQAIHEGHDTLAKLAFKTNATTGCGTCSASVQNILKKEIGDGIKSSEF